MPDREPTYLLHNKRLKEVSKPARNPRSVLMKICAYMALCSGKRDLRSDKGMQIIQAKIGQSMVTVCFSPEDRELLKKAFGGELQELIRFKSKPAVFRRIGYLSSKDE